MDKTFKIQIIKASDSSKFVIGDESDWKVIKKGLDGFGDLENTLGFTDNAVADGGYFTSEHISKVDRTIKFAYLHPETNDVARTQLLKFFNVKDSYKIYVTHGEKTFWAEGKIYKFKSGITTDVTDRISASVTFLFANPYWNSYDNFGKNIASLTGMVAFPFICPISKRITNLLEPTLASGTTSGVTYTKNADGTYTLNGKATANSFIAVNTAKMSFSTAQTLKFVQTSNKKIINRIVEYAESSGGEIGRTTEPILVNIKTNCTYLFQFGLVKNVVYDNVIVRPLLTSNLSATCGDYTPYGKPVSRVVPQGTTGGIFNFAQQVTIFNDGDVATKCKAIIASDGGEVTNPKLIINGEYVRILDVLQDKEEIELDFSAFPPTVKKAGQNFIGHCDRTSAFQGMVLEQGDNLVQYDADNGSSHMNVTIYYYKQYGAI